MPGGSEPPTVNVYGGVPPVHPKLTLNGVPVMAAGFEEPPPILSAGGLMVIVKSRESEVLALSLTFMLKVYVPVVVGLPVTSGPLEMNVRPGGRFPVKVNVNGGVPPLVLIVTE